MSSNNKGIGNWFNVIAKFSIIGTKFEKIHISLQTEMGEAILRAADEREIRSDPSADAAPH